MTVKSRLAETRLKKSTPLRPGTSVGSANPTSLAFTELGSATPVGGAGIAIEVGQGFWKGPRTDHSTLLRAISWIWQVDRSGLRQSLGEHGVRELLGLDRERRRRQEVLEHGPIGDGSEDRADRDRAVCGLNRDERLKRLRGDVDGRRSHLAVEARQIGCRAGFGGHSEQDPGVDALHLTERQGRAAERARVSARELDLERARARRDRPL